MNCATLAINNFAKPLAREFTTREQHGDAAVLVQL